MIKIEFEGATGAEIRKEMLELLGIQEGAKVYNLPLVQEELKKDLEVNVDEIPVQDKGEEQPKTRIRRSKAEIEAAKNAETSQEQPLDHPQVDAEPAAEGQSEITADDLTKKAVELGRAGHRDKVLAILENDFGGATISKKDGKPTLTPDQYEAVMDAFNAIG